MSDTVDTRTLNEEQKRGLSRAHLAAVYANLRTLLAATLREDDPVIGVFGFSRTERGKSVIITAGATPSIDQLLSCIGWLQGHVTANYVARQIGDMANAGMGDRYNLESGTVHCVSCADGDPTGAHAKEELERNAQAWLGLLVLIAQRVYGEHLPPEAREPLDRLLALALPADTEVS